MMQLFRSRKATRAINWDKKLCEKQGLVKLDVLGLTTLDIIDLCLSYINTRHSISLDLSHIVLDDKQCWTLLLKATQAAFSSLKAAR
jgi:DNA polymerase III alpha subunit